MLAQAPSLAGSSAITAVEANNIEDAKSKDSDFMRGGIGKYFSKAAITHTFEDLDWLEIGYLILENDSLSWSDWQKDIWHFIGILLVHLCGNEPNYQIARVWLVRRCLEPGFLVRRPGMDRTATSIFSPMLANAQTELQKRTKLIPVIGRWFAKREFYN